MLENWDFNEYDQKIIEGLNDFIPDQVFDIHAHLVRVSDLNLDHDNFYSKIGEEITLDVWKENVSKFTQGSNLMGGLFFPMISSCCDVQKCNDYLIEQLKGQTTSKGLILISPHMTRKEAEKYLEDSQIVGLKPYHLLSDKKPTN
ncbi:MAG: class III aminotransferase, partial [Clostridia bacterium]|nr:class III aminotransferase [Clostridia bacterium]